MNNEHVSGAAVRLSVWAECRCAGILARLMEREGCRGPLVRALAEHTGWTDTRVCSRLRIDRDVPPAVLYRAGVDDRQMEHLPLARLLDIARRSTVEDKAVCLSYAARGRRPRWADPC